MLNLKCCLHQYQDYDVKVAFVILEVVSGSPVCQYYYKRIKCKWYNLFYRSKYE